METMWPWLFRTQGDIKSLEDNLERNVIMIITDLPLQISSIQDGIKSVIHFLHIKAFQVHVSKYLSPFSMHIYPYSIFNLVLLSTSPIRGKFPFIQNIFFILCPLSITLLEWSMLIFRTYYSFTFFFYVPECSRAS